MSMFTTILVIYFMFYNTSNNSIKKQREEYIESFKNQEDEEKDESEIKAELEEINRKFLEEDSARTLVIMRYGFRVIWILFIINIIMPLTVDFWDALTANPTLGRIYQLLTLLSLVFIVIPFLFDLFPFFKFFSTKQLLSEGRNLFRFTQFSQKLRRMKFVRFFTIFFSVSSILLFISSQIILWGFIVW